MKELQDEGIVRKPLLRYAGQMLGREWMVGVAAKHIEQSYQQDTDVRIYVSCCEHVQHTIRALA